VPRGVGEPIVVIDINQTTNSFTPSVASTIGISYMLSQQMGTMATLSDLVTALAGVTGLPKSTVFAYGRFARQAGLISQKGRGRSAASMTLTDAANLLIAVAATGVTREAGTAVEAFRSLRRGRLYDLAAVRSLALLKWLEPLGIKPLDQDDEYSFEVRCDFGRFLEHLIAATLTGDLTAVFQSIPVAETPPELWREWKQTESVHLDESVDLLIKQGLLKPKAPSDLEFGEDVNLEVKFSRLVPAVEVEFLRMWDSPQTALLLTFGPEGGAQARAPHRMRLVATLTQHTIAALALVQHNMVRPSAVRTEKPMDALFSQQLRRLTGGSSKQISNA
jgi:hypothetical protein